MCARVEQLVLVVVVVVAVVAVAAGALSPVVNKYREYKSVT